MMRFIDSHAHLADPAFEADLAGVIERAREAGARGIVCIGASLAAAARSSEIATAHPGFISFTAGIHPHDAGEFDPLADVPRLREFCGAGRTGAPWGAVDAVAIGECGLDYHYDHAPRDRQRRAFAAQLALALEAGLPVVVHTREAEADTQAMVAEAGRAGVRGVLHCYTGTTELAEAALAVGWYVSFSGIITFKNWTNEGLLRLIPADRVLVESDAPYLAPVPNRGKRNEPAFVASTIAKLAAVRSVEVDSLAEQTAANAIALFSLGG